jgi:DNA-binding transcriptional MocR family regulator
MELIRWNSVDPVAHRKQIRERYDELRKAGLKINMARGLPSPEQLDLVDELLAMPGRTDYLAADRTDCRNYGNPQGLAELRGLFSGMLGIAPNQVVIGENSSLSLMHECVTYALLKGVGDSSPPWVKTADAAFLCPVPGYDRHFAICQELGIRMIPVPMLDDGPDMDQVESLAGKDPAVKGIWCVPKYSNPTGIVYADRVVERFAAMNTAAADFRIFWDNAYAVHDLTEDPPQLANIVDACLRHGHADRPFVFASTSKITFAGAGIAVFASSEGNVAWFMKRRQYRTIGPDKVNQLRHIRLFRDEAGLRALMAHHRAILAPKFTKVHEVFEALLGGSGVAKWTQPKGGYFISLDVPDGCARRVVELARQLGITLTPAGAPFPFGQDPRDRNIRIAPTFISVEDLAKAAEAVAVCTLVAVDESVSKERCL